jgi:hypothetical protein
MVVSLPQAVRENSTREFPQETLGAVPRDELERRLAGRHFETFLCSYHLAKYRNAALTADQMGHKNARVLYAHYREVVKNFDDITDYWTTFRPALAK